MILDNIQGVLSLLKKEENPFKVKDFNRFFKTANREYGEHDEFCGISMPQVHLFVKTYDIDFKILQDLILSEFNEYRMVALIFLRKYYTKIH